MLTWKFASLGRRPLVGFRRPRSVGGGRHPARSAWGGRFQSASRSLLKYIPTLVSVNPCGGCVYFCRTTASSCPTIFQISSVLTFSLRCAIMKPLPGHSPYLQQAYAHTTDRRSRSGSGDVSGHRYRIEISRARAAGSLSPGPRLFPAPAVHTEGGDTRTEHAPPFTFHVSLFTRSIKRET